MLCVSLLFSFFLYVQTQKSYVNECHEHHSSALDILINAAIGIAEKEGTHIQYKYEKAMQDIYGITGKRKKRSVEEDGTSWSPHCPMPNISMFTTTPPTQPPTTFLTSPGVTGGSTEASTAASTTQEQQRIFKAVPLYIDHPDDPLAAHMSLLHEYISQPEKSCNSHFTDLKSITPHQLYGFVATFASTDIGPFCSICHRMVDAVRKKVVAASTILFSEQEQGLARIMLSHIPSTQSVCSAIAPACYDNYEEKVTNITSSLICAECSACMTVTNVLQHRLLLNKKVVADFFNFLRSSFFHNICAELCNDLYHHNFNGNNYSVDPTEVFSNPFNFSYDGCQNFFSNSYNGVIQTLTTITRPERFCTLELGWCDLGESPNMLNCLYEICQDILDSHPFLKLICGGLKQMTPSEAAEFLNVHHQKKFKKRRPYHDEISVNHEEL